MFTPNKTGLIPEKIIVSANNKSYKKVTRKTMKPEFLELHKKYPNDYDLGEYLRSTYQNDLNASIEILEMIKNYPNNYELGKAFRELSLNS